MKSDGLTPEEKIRRGQHAERLLNDELFKEAIASARDRALDAFKAAKPNDAAAIQYARIYYDVIETFISDIHSLVSGGKIAQHNAKLEKANRKG